MVLYILNDDISIYDLWVVVLNDVTFKTYVWPLYGPQALNLFGRPGVYTWSPCDHDKACIRPPNSYDIAGV